MIVDTHCHLWQHKLASQTWLTPKFKHLCRTFDPSDLAEACQPVGTEAVVLIESGKTRGENEAFQEMAASSSLIAAMVPYVDLNSPDLAKDLDQWQQDPKFKGVRMGFEAHADPAILQRPAIVDGIRQIAQRGLIFEFLVQSPQLGDVLDICQSIPQLKAIVEHLAKPEFENPTDISNWQRQMKALAGDTHVHCKLSLSPRQQQFDGLLKNPGKGWAVDAIRPCVEFMLEQFGCERLVWGSDWPICLLVCDYRGAWHTMKQMLSDLSEDNQARIFGENARQFYDLAVD